MGRVKLPIQKIEKLGNRQVTFSKRRNGLIKKAYQLSVLCDVDVALIMFSPSGRVSLFSGNKSIEDVLERFLNLPEHEGGSVIRSYFRRCLVGAKDEEHHTFWSPSSTSTNEEFQQEIVRCKSLMEEMEKRLRIYEGEISTWSEAVGREHLLEEALGHVRLRKSVLEDENNSHQDPGQHLQHSHQLLQVHTRNKMKTSGIINPNNVMHMDWLDAVPQTQREQGGQYLKNLMTSNGVVYSERENDQIHNRRLVGSITSTHGDADAAAAADLCDLPVPDFYLGANTSSSISRLASHNTVEDDNGPGGILDNHHHTLSQDCTSGVLIDSQLGPAGCVLSPWTTNSANYPTGITGQLILDPDLNLQILSSSYPSLANNVDPLFYSGTLSPSQTQIHRRF